ncbi:MAG TPA: RNB domain-containing ribonuclease, partial [Rhizomicrobium sp.]|nr:RNB domain-containing ribonuclease [Rhizomicrobium sp.]
MKKSRSKKASSPQLDKSRVLEALAANPHSTKRDIARTLGVKGNARIQLKKILKELESEGALARGPRKTFEKPGTLPEVTVLEITGQDPDGELLARPQRWDAETPPPQIIVVPGREDEAHGPALGAGERILARLTETREGYEARVIKRLGASAHKVLGVYREGEHGGRIVPIDRKSKSEFIVDPRDRGAAKPNELVLCEPLSGRAMGLPRARVIERLGSMNEPRSVSLIAIHAHGIPTDFPKEALDEAERAKPADPRGRTDLRKFPLLTIDPEDARDHDDAVWAGPDSDPSNSGGHIVIVAIADVAHYVTPGSALDREALKRGNSAYFPDRVVPMLPERLSADLCSLMENEDRPCLAVRMIFDKHGNKKRHEFVRGIMRSAASLTYAQAQRAFDGEDKSEMARNVLRPLWNAYQTMAQARDRRDPLNLDLPERGIVIGADGKIQSIAFRERLESMRL